MPKKESDQRSYSVDEMMEKLREGDREKRKKDESELVTRPDGSQVMRVRRRKRRSSQPAKAKQVRQRRYGLLAAVAGVVLIVAFGALVLVLLARVNSKDYREGFKSSLQATTGAQPGVEDLSISPFRAQARSLQLVWPAGGMVKTLKLENLSADLHPTSLFGSQLKGREVISTNGTMMVGPPTGTLAPSLPDGNFPLSYGGYRCSNFNLFYGEEAANTALHVRSTELTLRPHDDGGIRFKMSGGFLDLGNWGELKLDHGLAELKDGRFTLISLFTRQGEKGEANFKGAKAIGSTGPTVFDVALVHYPLGQLLGAEGLGQLLGGIVEVPGGSLSVDPRSVDSGQVKLKFTGKEGRLEGFRFLSGLSSILRGKDYYTRPAGGQISGVINWSRDSLSIENFSFEARDQLILQGNISLNPETGGLSGSLRVGVPEVLMMRTQTERRYLSFTMPQRGYCWIDIDLGGTVQQPTDSLIDKLEASPHKARPSRTVLPPPGQE